jgi:hypothetical protein
MVRKKRGKDSFMTSSASLDKRKTLCFVILFITFFTFTADIFDLREELNIISCPYNCLDNNITAGITDNFPFEPEPILTSYSVHGNSSFEITFLHLLPCGFRAPPSCS